MKKNLFYLVMLFTFFLGVTNCFGVTITNYGLLSEFNDYTCGETNKSVLKLHDESGISYYTESCDANFPCSYGSSTENECVGTSGYIYSVTGSCYVTCDNLNFNLTSDSDIGNNQYTIWNNFSNYEKTTCDEDRINSTNLQNAINSLIDKNICKENSNYYILQEYNHSVGDIVSIKTVNSMCSPQVKIKKECVGFNDGTFKVKVGDNEIELSCGETSEPIDVVADTPIEISEINSEGYMVYYSSNLEDGKITVNSGTQIVTIKNAVGKVNLTKINGSNKSPIAGINFKLEKLVNGEWVTATNYKGETINNLATNSDGKLSFDGLLTGKYRFVEVSDLNGNYIASDSTEFEISKDEIDSNYSENITIENNPFKLILKKVDTNGNPLKDAIFMIQKNNSDNDPETVAQLIVENGEANIQLEKTGHYTITEIQSPSGYDLLNDSIIIVLENGAIKESSADENYVKINLDTNLLTIEVLNDKSKVKLYKRDSATGNILAGAKLLLKKTDGTLTQEIITSNGAYATTLEPGHYILSELYAPKGYEKINDNFEFIVKEDGTIETVANSGLFEISGLNINLYNIKPTIVPDTGIGLNILLTVLGLSLFGGGSYLIYKNVKKSKNVK